MRTCQDGPADRRHGVGPNQARAAHAKGAMRGQWDAALAELLAEIQAEKAQKGSC